MKNAEKLISLMEELQNFVGYINELIESGVELFLKAKEWINKIIDYIGLGVEKLMDAVNGKKLKLDFLEFKEEDMFV